MPVCDTCCELELFVETESPPECAVPAISVGVQLLGRHSGGNVGNISAETEPRTWPRLPASVICHPGTAVDCLQRRGPLAGDNLAGRPNLPIGIVTDVVKHPGMTVLW